MALAWPERRALHQIEGALRHSDPGLAARLSMFGQLTRYEAMPGGERLFPLPWPLAWLRRTVPAQAARVVPVMLGTVALGLMITFFALVGHSGRQLTFPDRACQTLVPGTCQAPAAQVHAFTPARPARPGR